MAKMTKNCMKIVKSTFWGKLKGEYGGGELISRVIGGYLSHRHSGKPWDALRDAEGGVYKPPPSQLLGYVQIFTENNPQPRKNSWIPLTYFHTN